MMYYARADRYYLKTRHLYQVQIVNYPILLLKAKNKVLGYRLSA